MHRRRVLAVTAAGSGLAGCIGQLLDRSPPAPTEERAGSVSPDTLPVSRDELQQSVPRDGIPAIVDPAFDTDWSDVPATESNLGQEEVPIQPRLHASDTVIGITRAGTARAYPLRILNWHEIVNDRLNDPLLVAYCPLCRSGITAVRRVRGEETVFGVSGELWQANLVMYDRLTDSRWSQIAATAIRGPETGTTLDLLPSTITTWAEWQREHADSEVLLPPPNSSTVRGRNATRDYTVNPYTRYETSRQVGPGTSFGDDRLHPKALVIGVTAAASAMAFPLSVVSDADVVNTRVGDRPVVVTVTSGETLVAYDRRIAGTVVEFDAEGERLLRGAGSRWERVTGRAIGGRHVSKKLTPANELPPLYWFSWLEFHPDSGVYRADPST